MDENDIKNMLANPFYCLPIIDPIFCGLHEAIVDRELWIKANVRQIQEIGSEEFLRRLLDNLEGVFKT